MSTSPGTHGSYVDPWPIEKRMIVNKGSQVEKHVVPKIGTPACIVQPQIEAGLSDRIKEDTLREGPT